MLTEACLDVKLFRLIVREKDTLLSDSDKHTKLLDIQQVQPHLL
jgi:hypothetical protein